MTHDCLKLTIYFGERDRTANGFLADAICDLFERHAFKTSVVIRGVEGFGLKHTLQTDRLLTLSEDLPLVAIAIDTRERIQRALPEVVEVTSHGLVTLERARLVENALDVVLPDDPDQATKLTLYGGRAEMAGRRPSYVAAVDCLRRHGAAGASVVLGVDGTLQGTRRRARFFSRNVQVPLMILAVAPGPVIAAALPEVRELFAHPVITLERVQLCKAAGALLAIPRHLPERDESGLPMWQKLMVHTEVQARFDGRPLYVELVRRLRETGAAGATVLRGIWGFYGDRGPFGDRFFTLRRQAPVHVVIVDTPEKIQESWRVVDAATTETGFVTSELVPASHASAPRAKEVSLRLASPSRGP